MEIGTAFRREIRLALTYALVAGLGFCTDATVLKLGVLLGLAPAGARIVSLLAAMQMTFLVNGLFVFRRLEWKTAPLQWATYMCSSGFGNLCNYSVFVALISLNRPLLSNPLLALAIGGVAALMINYVSARLLVFGTITKDAHQTYRARSEATQLKGHA